MQCWMLVLFSVCLWHSRKETFLLPLADLNNIWSISRLYKKTSTKKRENGCWVKLVRFQIKWSWKVIVQCKIQTGACTCGDFCWHRWLSFAFLWCSVSSLQEAKKVDFPQISWSQCALRRPVMWCCHHTIRYSVHNSAVSEVVRCWWLCCIRCWGCGVMKLRSPTAARRGRLQHHF